MSHSVAELKLRTVISLTAQSYIESIGDPSARSTGGWRNVFQQS